MNKINVGKSGLTGSSVVLGCMRISNMSEKEIEDLVFTAYENGIDYFDHSDIYQQNGVQCDAVFGSVLKNHPKLREKIIIQSKCGIKSGLFDFSKEHILKSVEGSLKRLNTEYLDVLLLHRPDTLFEPEEVAAAFDELHKSGKVKNFGVSNQNPMQIELLKKYINVPLIANQLQFGLMASGMIDCGFNVNMTNTPSYMHDGSILEYCRLNDITIQAWSPFLYGFFEGVFIDNDKFPELNKELEALANKYGVTKNAIATAWILRHPAKMQVIIGSTNIKRVSEICKAIDFTLTREEWYSLYRAAGNKLP